MRIGPAAAAVLGIALQTGACADPVPRSPTPADLEAVDLSADHTITVDEAGFEPAHLEIDAGEVVVLVNEGNEGHTFTAEERFDTGLMEPGDETTLILGEPGEIPYWDDEAPDHTATIVVRDG